MTQVINAAMTDDDNKPHLVPDVKTPISIRDVASDLIHYMHDALGVVPGVEDLDAERARSVVELKCAHIAFECGFDDHGMITDCHCHNVGNIKHVDNDGHNWCMFKCKENVALDKQGQLSPLLRSPYVKRIGNPYQKNGRVVQYVEISPPHSWSRFVANANLREGMAKQYSYLLKHPAVLEAMLTGDLEKYNHQLALAVYYTASERVYLQGLKTRLAQVKKQLEKWEGWDVAT